MALLLLWTNLAAASSAASAEEPLSPDGWRIERIDRAEALPPAGRVEVDNPHGDLRVRSGPAGRLSVHGVRQTRPGETGPRLEIVAGGNGLSLRIAPGSDAPPPAGEPPSRLDLALEVPADSPLSLRTVGGLIEARGFAAPLHARSRSGEIRLRGSGAVDVATEHGAVRVAFHPRLADGPSRFETVSGEIEVELPARAAATARLETQGRLTTDFTLAVERVGPLSKRARATIGGGGPELVLISRLGGLALLERLAPSPAADARPVDTPAPER